MRTLHGTGVRPSTFHTSAPSERPVRHPSRLGERKAERHEEDVGEHAADELLPRHDNGRAAEHDQHVVHQQQRLCGWVGGWMAMCVYRRHGGQRGGERRPEAHKQGSGRGGEERGDQRLRGPGKLKGAETNPCTFVLATLFGRRGVKQLYRPLGLSYKRLFAVGIRWY